MYDIVIRIIADGLVVPIALVGAVAMWRIPSDKRYVLFAKGLIAALTALLFAKVASLLYQGERPFMALDEAPKAAYLNNPGFPSDHALLVFTITLVVWVSTKNKKLALTLFIMSTLVAIGRVAALVHTPWDVLGGAACALVAACVVYGRALFQRT